MTKEEAQKVIQENMADIQSLLRESQSLGKEHNVEFAINVGQLSIGFYVPDENYEELEWDDERHGFNWVPSDICW